MKDIEKAAAKLRSLEEENKASGNRSMEFGRLEQIRQEAKCLINGVDLDLAANEEKDPTEPRSQGVHDKPSRSSMGAVDQDFDFRQIKIPLKALRESGHITPNCKKNKLTEEYRRIKRPLVRNLDSTDIPTNRNLVMVTSAVAGEGKTFTSINLAMSLAQELGRQVIFIDADVIKGSAGLKLGAGKGAPGLIDILSGAVSDVREVVQRTNVRNLWFISAGNFDRHANELLASDSMEQCIQDLTTLFEECILVFDCPPILLTNEANELLYHAGQIVFVVAERLSNQKHVKSALAQIDDSKYVGIVLNKSRNKRADYSYGYSYGKS